MIDTFSAILLSLVALLTAWGARRDLEVPLWVSFCAFVTVTCVCMFTLGPASASLGALALVCLLIIETDRRHYLIPDALTLALLVLGFVLPFDDDLQTRALGAAALGGVFLATRQIFASRGGSEALGLGDVKLAGAIGGALGPVYGFYVVLIAGLATMLVVAIRVRGGALAVGAPFGVGLAAATAATALIRALAP